MKCGIGQFIKSAEDVETAHEFDRYGGIVQLGFYETSDSQWKNDLITMKNVTSIHLPKGLYLHDYDKGGFVDSLRNSFDVSMLVVHPWAEEIEDIVHLVQARKEYILCLEVFSWTNVHGKASPFVLVEKFGKLMSDPHSCVGLCVDFSHLAKEFITYPFLKSLLPYTKMYHISTRSGMAQHLPYRAINVDVPIVSLLGQLLGIQHNPVREWILEYMPEHLSELRKDYFAFRDFVKQKRRRYGDV